jgi:hypothetical protein
LAKPAKARIPMSDAKTNVKLHRLPVDAYNGIPGMAMECMNSQCGLREAEKFTEHRVFLMEFTDTRAFVVDRLNAQGMPAHCVRYYHHQMDEQREFDKPGGKQRLLAAGLVEKDIHLLAPTKSTRHIPNPNPRPRNENGRETGPRRGSLARWLRSLADERVADPQ